MIGCLLPYVFTVLKLEDTPAARACVDNPLGAPVKDTSGDWSRSVVREVELAVLDEIENMEDRIYHASLQVKVIFLLFWGWGRSDRESTPDETNIHPQPACFW